MMLPFDWNALARISAERIVDSLASGTLIALATSILLLGARRLTAKTRFVVWFGTMMAIAALAMVDSGAVDVAGKAGAPVRTPLMLPGAWALYICGAWIAIAGVLLARVVVGIVQVRHLRASCKELGPALVGAEVRDALKLHAGSRRVDLCTSELVRVPTAIGFWRPAIVLPSWLVSELSASELKQVVLHEAAHLRRWDDWTNLAQQVVKAVLFFHPAVWWIEGRVSLEREMACDDAVIAATADPYAYAACLAHLAESSMLRRGLALAQAVLGRAHQTSHRVAQILRKNRPIRPTHSRLIGVGVLAGVAAVCGITILDTPKLIAFRPDQPQIVAVRSVPPAPIVAIPAASGAVTTVAKPQPRALAAVAKVLTPAVAPRRSDTTVENDDSAPARDLVFPARLTEHAAAPATTTQDVYFVIESRDYLPSGAVLYRTTVWRITVSPAAENLKTRVPQKQT